MNSNSPSNLSVAGFEIRTRQCELSKTCVHENPLLDRLYQVRGISSKEQLTASLSKLLPYEAFMGMSAAVELLNEAKQKHWRVLIVGDYDTDGATSTALAVLGLRSMGIDVQYLLPNRFEYGYGLSVEIVELALTLKPDLIVTVDNGIASVEGVTRAKDAGCKVLVTDHPNADAIVNPNQPGCTFPSKAACGCTVMFYVLAAFRAKLREMGETNLPNLGQWLDLVSLATVADVVPLDENNRTLVQQGLSRVRAGECRLGIKALFEVAGRSWRDAKSSDYGFVVGPRLNAAGRLDDMTIGVQLLLSENETEAKLLAAQLQDLNQERRQIEASMVHEVQSSLQNIGDFSDSFGAVVYGEGWHEGVIGILASRVKDKIHKPVVAFSDASNGMLKGSARSVPGVHLKDCLDWISKQAPETMAKFGGHAMAAGLSIPKASLNVFENWFNEAVKLFSTSDALTPQLWTDGQLEQSEMTLTNALALENAGPWGQAFPEPSFSGAWAVSDSKVLSGTHLEVSLHSGNQIIQGIAFNVSESLLNQQVSRIRGTYQLSCNRFRGETTLQLIFSKIEAT